MSDSPYSVDTPDNSDPFQALRTALTKKPEDRTLEDCNSIAKVIYNLKYFQNMVYNEEERLDFASGCAKYFKYEIFPKGTQVLRKGDPGNNFYVIMKGEAFVYVPKSDAEFQRDSLSKDKKLAFEEYSNYILKASRGDDTSSQSLIVPSTKRVRSRSVVLTQETAELFVKVFTIDNPITRLILSPDNTILKDEIRDDLTFEEKLLLLNQKQTEIDPYFVRGIATFKKVVPLHTGDFFGELALIYNQPRLASIIAAEDLHLLSLTSDDYMQIFDSEVKNVLEKMNFFQHIFFGIPQAARAKFCYLLEEKTYKFNDIIYKEGDSGDAIYIIKQGEIQLSTYATQNGPEDPSAYRMRRGSIYQRRIVAATLVNGNFFGDTETIAGQKRKYTAMCSTTTFVYKLSKYNYNRIIEQYFPAIATFLKNQAEASEEHRKIRTEHTQRVQFLALPTAGHKTAESTESLNEEAKDVETKLKSVYKRTSEFIPLHFKSKYKSLVLKDEEEEANNRDVQTNEVSKLAHVQVIPSNTSINEAKELKTFLLSNGSFSARRSKLDIPTTSLTPNYKSKNSFNDSKPFEVLFPMPPTRRSKVFFSNVTSPESKCSSPDSIGSGKLNLPEIQHRKSSFSGLNLEKIPDFGFSTLVSKLKNNSNIPQIKQPPLSEESTPSHLNTLGTPRQNKGIKGKKLLSPFAQNSAIINKEKVNSSPQKSSSEMRISLASMLDTNEFIQNSALKSPFKHMKTPRKLPRDLRELKITGQGSATERKFISQSLTPNLSSRTSRKHLSSQISTVTLNSNHIERREHDNVENNQILSELNSTNKLTKTKHNMFRVFKGST